MRHMLLFLTVFLGLTAQAQTQIVDGIALSNAYNATNFIQNPNAQKNTVGVSSDDSSTITRSTTTPLYAGSEFNVTDAGAWSIKWDARAFDAGMSGRTCEAKVIVRGVAGTATLAVLDNATVLYSATGTPNATNAIPISVVFPCGSPAIPKLKLSGTTAITGTLEVDAAYLGLAVSVASGEITTQWQTYTATLTNVGANATQALQWRRQGPNLQLRGRITFATGGLPTGTVVISLPTGLTATSSGNFVGVAGGGLAASPYFPLGSITMFTNTTFYILVNGSNSGWNATLPATWANGDYLELNSFSVPIVGWAATDIVTPESTISGQARYTTNAAQSIPNATATIVDFEDKDYDINNEVTTGAAWKFTAKSPGYYQVSSRVLFSSSSTWNAGEYAALRIVKNGSDVLRTDGKTADATVTQNMPAEANGAIYLNTGDYVQISAFQSSGGSLSIINDGLYNSVTVAKLSGTSNQSVYISSPIVADPVTNTVKAKNTSGTDLMTIAGATGGMTVGNDSGTTAGHLVQSSVNNDFALTVRNRTTGVSGAEGLDVVVGDTTSDDAFRVRAGSTVLGGVKGTGASAWGPSSGLTSPHQFNAGTATARIITLNQTDAANNNAIISTYDAGTLMGSFGSSTAYPFSIFSNTDSVAFHIPAGLGDGTLTLTGKVVGISSDSRLKDEVSKPKHAGLSEILKLQTHYYTWKDKAKGDSIHFGFYSQEVGKHIPEAMGKPGEDGMYGFYDRPVIAALVNGMKEQQAQINCLVNANNKKEREACVAGVK